jgi:hypothetical protein
VTDTFVGNAWRRLNDGHESNAPNLLSTLDNNRRIVFFALSYSR